MNIKKYFSIWIGETTGIFKLIGIAIGVLMFPICYPLGLFISKITKRGK